MDRRLEIFMWTCCVAVAAATLIAFSPAAAIGVNYGTLMSHPMLPTTVVQMIRANGITKVKLFDADAWTLSAFAGTGIEVMVAIPNHQLERLSNDYGHAQAWVKENVTQYNHNGGVIIKYVAVGNEPFLKSYKGLYEKTLFPALKNIQQALNDAGVGDRIKAIVPMNGDVYGSPEGNSSPSGGDFRADLRSLMVEIVRYMNAYGAPFVTNIYPFFNVYQNSEFPPEFAFFDSGESSINDKGKQYTNVFDANYDTLVWSLKKAGVGSMKIIVGEVGWPTDGNANANVTSARKFYRGFMKKMASNEGTPMRPGHIEAYLFGLVDEDLKSTLPGNFERHWGIFTYDGKPKFPIDLSGKGNERYPVGAVGVQYLPELWCVLNPDANQPQAVGASMEYACMMADCTTLAAGGSCADLDPDGHASYAFNIYFQMQDQDVRACDFAGQAIISIKNASRDGCRFPIQIVSAAGGPAEPDVVTLLLLAIAALLLAAI